MESKAPALKLKPSLMPWALTIAGDDPVSTAWSTYSGNATNMNESSSGSVTPVRKLVGAAESMMPPTIFFWPGLGLVPDGERRGRQREHHDGEEPGHEGPGGGVPGEDPVEV